MKKVLLLLASGFETIEASAFIDVMGWNLLEGDSPTELFTVGLRREIISSFNQRFVVDYLLEEMDAVQFDALAIPGGFEEYGFYQDAYDERFLTVIRDFYSRNKIIASICVGALPLATSGVLIGKKATTYSSDRRRDALIGFGAEIVDQQIVVHDQVITSQNPATALNVAFLLLEMLTSSANTERIKRSMGF